MTYNDNGEQKLDFESISVSHVSQIIKSIHCIEPCLAVQVAISLHQLGWSILTETDVFELRCTTFQLPLGLL